MLNDMNFKGNWRDYQARILEEMDEHFDDGRLHVVAAPVRTDPALRSERFVSDWQGLSAARKQLEQQGDRAGAARVSAMLTELAKGLERDPQVEGLLRGKTRELGIEPKPERSIANELTATLTRERTRDLGMGL